jgi:hypothetical protein
MIAQINQSTKYVSPPFLPMVKKVMTPEILKNTNYEESSFKWDLK